MPLYRQVSDIGQIEQSLYYLQVLQTDIVFDVGKVSGTTDILVLT